MPPAGELRDQSPSKDKQYSDTQSAEAAEAAAIAAATADAEAAGLWTQMKAEARRDAEAEPALASYQMVYNGSYVKRKGITAVKIRNGVEEEEASNPHVKDDVFQQIGVPLVRDALSGYNWRTANAPPFLSTTSSLILHQLLVLGRVRTQVHLQNHH